MHVDVNVEDDGGGHPHPAAAAVTAQAAPAGWRQTFDSFKLTDTLAKGAMRPANVQKYYRKQQAVIDQYLNLDAEQRREMAASNHSHHGKDDEPAAERWASRLSLVLNVALLGIKLYAAIVSGSLTIAASLVDSALDLFSGGVLIVVGCLRRILDKEDYPTGKHRFEPLGTLVFSCVMCVASAKLIEEAVNDFLSPIPLSIDIPVIVVMCVVIVFKLVAHIICRRVAASTHSSGVQALADDHRNDVAQNFFGLCAILLAKFVWRLTDPLVALLTTLVIMFMWSRSAYFQISALSGKTAPPTILNALTLLARNHDPRVVAVDTVRAVTGGDGYVVEIDLVLPGDMPLREAHDIGESFQIFLEGLAGLDIARAYVHIDHETTHDPREHR